MSLRDYCIRRGTLLFLLVVASVCMQGQGLYSDSLEMKSGAISEVEVKARKVPIQVTSIEPKQSLTRRELDVLGIQGVADAVKRMAGAYVRDYGGLGGLKTVSVRSLGASHTAVEYDGVTVSDCQTGQVDIGRFSLENVEEISLTIGQESHRLQSARGYASAGVLAIRSSRPVFSEGHTADWNVRLRGGAFGYLSPSLRYARKLGTRTSVVLDGDFMRADGMYPFTLKNGHSKSVEKRVNSDIVSWHAEMNFRHQFSDSSRISLKTYFYDSERGLPGAVKLYNLEAQYRERLWDENIFVQTTYEKSWSSAWSLLASAKYNHTWSRYEDKDVSYAKGKMTDVNRQDEYYLTASVGYSPSATWNFALAQDGAINSLHSNLPHCPFPERYTLLTALSVNFNRPWVKVKATLLNTFVTERVQQGTRPEDRKRLSPSVGVTFRPFAGEHLYVRFLYKELFRIPTFNDMYYSRVGNKMLKPEKAVQYNAGLTYDATLPVLFDHLTVTVDGYLNRVTDKIVAIPTAYVWKMYNFGKVHIAGLDATMVLGVPLSERIKLRLKGNYTYQRAVDRTDSSTKYYGDQLPYTPRHMGNISAQLNTPWMDVGYTLMTVGERYCQAQNIEMNRISGYKEHSLTFSRKWHCWNIDWSLQAEWLNFTDEQYEVIKYYPMPGASWRLSLAAAF